VPSLVNNTEVLSISSFSFLDLGNVAGLSESEDCDSREVGWELDELEVAWACGVLNWDMFWGLLGVKYRELGGELPEDSLRVSYEPSEESTLVSQNGNSSSEGYGEASGEDCGVVGCEDGGVTK
jgi:hypothetical protein